MAELKIKNIPQGLIDKINTLFEQSKHPDRSSFLVAALEDYCLYHDQYFMHTLPDTIRILAEDIMKKEAKKNAELLQYTLSSVNNCGHLMQQIIDVISYENTEDDLSESDDV
jgi:hypothetical protein